mmetsp:Transcript_8027/g.16137  ORF Transcript_8027/g.16137 Transcript_8027/m.16137 type:complete len:212 (+) Transcript_8027:1185-1820(+)
MRKLTKETQVILVELTNVRNAVKDHRESFDTESSGKALPFVRIEACHFKNIRIYQSTPTHLEPSTSKKDVEFHAGLRKGKVTSAKSNLNLLLKHFSEKVNNGGPQASERQILCNRHDLNLMKQSGVRSIDAIASINSTRRHDREWRFVTFHVSDLDARGVCPQQGLHIVVEIKGVLHVTSRVIGWNVERLKVVVVCFNLGAKLRVIDHFVP